MDRWERYPEITLERTIDQSSYQIINPFGGLIYIVVPSRFQSSRPIELEISGAVAAPYFIKNQTSSEDWKTLREAPAPWAELQGDNVILTVPSAAVRKLENPQELMETWDTILDLIAEFSSTAKKRIRPERLCTDRQISAGYMHSGYPIMTGLDVQNDFVDSQKLKSKGNWGFFHELGHNHQSRDWTFDGSGEVTVNYFTLYVYDKFCGIAPEDSRKDLSPAIRKQKLSDYLRKGRRFDDWKEDPFLALNMTVQLQKEFGWNPFLQVIKEYQTAPKPQNDDEKRDLWLIRLSRATGRNLGHFFEFWGVPTSPKARDSLKGLPVWLPDECVELSKNFPKS